MTVPPNIIDLSTLSPAQKKQLGQDIRARWEMVETAKARELAAMTDDRVLEIIESLGNVHNPWHPSPHTSGLVEQQALFHRKRPSR